MVVVVVVGVGDERWLWWWSWVVGVVHSGEWVVEGHAGGGGGGDVVIVLVVGHGVIVGYERWFRW